VKVVFLKHCKHPIASLGWLEALIQQRLAMAWAHRRVVGILDSLPTCCAREGATPQ